MDREECLEEVAGMPGDCLMSCEGLYAVIKHVRGTSSPPSWSSRYNSFKDTFSKNILFDPAAKNLSKYYEIL